MFFVLCRHKQRRSEEQAENQHRVEDATGHAVIPPFLRDWQGS
jgi:hypothetical protein